MIWFRTYIAKYQGKSLGTTYSLWLTRLSTQALLLVLMVLGLMACGEVTGNPDNRFTPIEPLLDQQAKLLTTLKPRVEKRVLAEGQEEVKTFETVDWQKELSAFRIADISKPGIQGAYSVEDMGPHIRVFRLKPGEKAEVQQLRIEYDEHNQVKSIQTVADDQNYLYHTRRTFQLNFATRNNQQVLESYQIAGFQKLLWSQEKPFAVQANVL